jgi:hypothetical protein
MGTNYYLVTTDNPDIKVGLHIGKMSNGDTWMFQGFMWTQKVGQERLNLNNSNDWFQALDPDEYPWFRVKDENNNIIDREEFINMIKSLKPASIPQDLPDCLKAQYYTDAWGYTFLKGDWD